MVFSVGSNRGYYGTHSPQLPRHLTSTSNFSDKAVAKQKLPRILKATTGHLLYWKYLKSEFELNNNPSQSDAISIADRLELLHECGEAAGAGVAAVAGGEGGMSGVGLFSSISAYE